MLSRAHVNRVLVVFVSVKVPVHVIIKKRNNFYLTVSAPSCLCRFFGGLFAFDRLFFLEFFRAAVSMFGLIGILLNRLCCTVVNPSGLSESFVSEECGLFFPSCSSCFVVR